MKRPLLVAMLFVFILSALGPTHAESLPTGGDVVAGDASIEIPTSDHITVRQGSDRSVIRWDAFDIGAGAHVDFIQPGREAATLNIVDATTSSTLAGRLTATGSVFLINPHGITVTSDGEIDTGGVFVASTLDLTDTDQFGNFMNGSTSFVFHVAAGDIYGTVVNEGMMTAQDVVLLGRRVHNSGTVTARLGRVALGSASHAVLDLTGDGFLQVLAPAGVDGEEALITNSGTLSADGGVVQLKAATAYDAMREAVNMPGTVRARSVLGRDGSVVFSGGEGGDVAVAGTVDVSPDTSQGGSVGGSLVLQGVIVDVDFDNIRVGSGGRFYLAADSIAVVPEGGYSPGGATRIVEGLNEGNIGDLLRAGVNVTLHGNQSIDWQTGLMIHASQLTEEAGGKAGDMHLLAGREIALGGFFTTYNGNWTLTANAKPAFGPALEGGTAGISMFSYPDWARFVNDNGHLTLEILGGEKSAGLDVYGIQLPVRFAGEGIVATISPDALGYDSADIRIIGDMDVRQSITLGGHLRTIRQEVGGVTTLSGHTVTWATEQNDRLAGGLLRFVEDGVVTRFGRGGLGPTAPGVDATRLVLGSADVFPRLYGEADPGQLDLGGFLLTLASHNKLAPGEGAVDMDRQLIVGIPEGGIPLTEILASGSIAVVGPGVRAETNAVSGLQYYLILEATDELAFKPLQTETVGCCDASYVSGAAGAYWIDMSSASETASRIPLAVMPRPLTVEMLDPSYVYGTPEPMVKLHGVVNGDDVLPVGRLGRDGDETDIMYAALGDGFGLDLRTNRGEYTYTVTGVTGDGAGNYVLDVGGLPPGVLRIDPRPVHYFMSGLARTYGSAELPGAELRNGLLAGDDVVPVVGLLRGGEVVENDERLPVGLYEAKVTDLVGEDADNYVVAGEAGVALRVQPKPIAWSVADTTSVYGTMATLDVALHGVLAGDEVLGNVALRDVSAPLTARTNVGTYITVVNGLLGEDRGNYALLTDWLDPRNTAGRLTIAPKVLSLNADPVSFEYGDASGGRFLGGMPLPRLLGALSGDEVLLKRGRVQTVKIGEFYGPTGGDVGVGEYELRIVVDGDGEAALEGLDSHNYALADGVHSLTVTVMPKPLDVTVGDVTSVYGTLASPDLTFHGVLAADQVFGEITLRQGSREVGFDARTPAGLYTMRVTGLWGDAAANYTLSLAGQGVGLLQIAPKVLQLATPVTMTYGDELRFDATGSNGVLDGDTVHVTVDARSADGSSIARPGAGTYVGVATGITGADAGNYVLPDGSGRILPGLAISKRPLTAHVLDHNRTYGDFPHAAIRFDNVVPGDVPLGRPTFGVATDPNGSFVTLTERTGVGTYWLRLTGLDDPNYTLAASGHTDGVVRISPKPIRYVTFDQQVEYGATDPVFSGLTGAQLLEGDVLPGDQVWAGDVIVADRELYPERLQASGKYRLALEGLGGIHSRNYIIEHVTSTQGLLMVTPRRISAEFDLFFNDRRLETSVWTFGDMELEHGFAASGAGFSARPIVAGVLAGDDVSVSVLAPALERSGQGYLSVGEYVWSVHRLTGADSSNYVLENNAFTRRLFIDPRPVRLMIGADDMVYGEPLVDLNLRFAGDDDRFFFGNDALDTSNLVLRTVTGFKRSVDDLTDDLPARLPAGTYFLGREDGAKPALLGKDAKNFDVTLAGPLTVDPRPLTFAPPTTDWIYGQRLTTWRLYSDIFGPAGGLGIIPGDDVSVEYSSAGRGIGENNMDARLDPESLYNPAGAYSGFGFVLTGDDAQNYELKQPDYTVTVKPRPLELPSQALHPGDDGNWEFIVEFTDEVRPGAGDNGGVLPRDEEDMFVGVWGDDGVVRPIHDLDAGRYDLASLGLTGRWAGNYDLQIRHPGAFLRIDPRSLLFSIEDVIGQYGNFLACLDPMTCNGGPGGPYGDRYLWAPGLKLGDVELEGVLPGHDVSVGSIILIDANGRTGRLDDVPPPGVYFQVVDGLVGKDAHNYRIAATGSRPGVLTMAPQWVRWETTDGIYMPEIGFRSLNPYFKEGFELVEGLQATVTAAMGELDLDPVFQLVGFDIDLWEDTHIADPRNLRPGNYYVEVTGFTEPFDLLYQPLPRSMSNRGILSVFADSRLGLESVDTMSGLEPSEDGDAFAPIGAGAGGSGASVHTGSPASGGTSTSGGSGASDANSSSDFSGRFGFGIDQELFETAGMRGDAYVRALAEYGVTGVRLRAEAGITVEYQIGKGYVETGAEARAQAEAGPTGVSASARASARAGGGARGSLGGGVDGEASGHIGVIAVAEGKAGLVFEDGKFAVGTKSHVGAGVSVGTEGSLSWHAGSVDVGVTVYSPGTIGQNFTFGAGFEGSVLTINTTVGLSLGFGGVEWDLDFSIDLGGFEDFGCNIGLFECTPSDLEIGEGHALAALDMAHPMERFAFLLHNPEWRYIGGAIQAGNEVDPDAAQAYYENQFFFDYVEELLMDVERYIADQEVAQAQFFHDLENDPASALHIARNLHRDSGYFARQAQSIHQRMAAIGLQLEIRRESLSGVRTETAESTGES